jgi:hypothetical protein
VREGTTPGSCIRNRGSTSPVTLGDGVNMSSGRHDVAIANGIVSLSETTNALTQLGLGTLPQKTYVLTSAADLWPLTAKPPAWSAASETSIVVSDLPSVSAASP